MTTLALPSLKLEDKLTRWQKLLIILRNHPEYRNSYDLIVAEYRRQHPDEKVTRSSLERISRMIQYDIGLYPPSKRIKRVRKNVQESIIQRYKNNKLNLSPLQKILSFFK